MNNTLLRKGVMTYVRQHHKDMKELVANKLLHNPKTSDRFYNTMRKSKKSAETSMFLSTTFKGSHLPYPQLRKKTIADIGAVKNIWWEKRQIDQLQEIFDIELKVGNINTNVVSAKMSELEMAFKDIFDSMSKKDAMKKILDKLRHLRSNMTETNPEPEKVDFYSSFYLLLCVGLTQFLPRSIPSRCPIFVNTFLSGTF